MNAPRSRNVSNKKYTGAKTKKVATNEENEGPKKPQSRSKKNVVSSKKIPKRIVIDDVNICSFAVEPAVNRPSSALSPVFGLPILEHNDLLHPQLQSSLSVLATIETLKSQEKTIPNRKQAVENMLSKAQNCTVSSISLEKKIFHDLKPIKVNTEVIEKEFHHFSSSAVGNAPMATNTAKEKCLEKHEQMEYPFKITLKPLIEVSPFNQFTTSYGIKLMADKTLPADCCVNVAMKDLS